ncbi:MAG TPA: hypothetical protein VMZ91_01530 [Candidatus Paceibacterota bacterium]|nr:hypothetical protein [Candidatus Paceibacterota bacterium]
MSKQLSRAMMKDKDVKKHPYDFIIQGNYGHGWEDVNTEDNYSDARRSLREYDENERGYSHRKIIRRIKK